ncbi:late competence development ComFB family protein [Halalkalibacter akibai]|uniref:late competence development ComFB family protein n=1 Tax=Halalkalibacter akibai TaxID=1411 RepID=UPI0005590CD3|nr:late competence development ComFB family protein [Halalkalibacter akibai]
METRGYRNIMEEIVEVLVDILLTGPEYQAFCKCKKCRNDVIALSLNSLSPQYATTQENRQSIYENYNQPNMRNWVNKRIISSLHIVNKYPQHKK